MSEASEGAAVESGGKSIRKDSHAKRFNKASKAGKGINFTIQAANSSRERIASRYGNASAGRSRNGSDLNRKPTTRTFSVYIGNDNAFTAFRIYFAVQALFPALGVESYAPLSVEEGSVLVKLRAWGKRFAQKREVRVVASQLVLTAEAMTVDKALSENTERHGRAIAAVAESMKHAESVVLDLGSLQYAHYTDEDGKIHIRARALSSKELAEHRLSDEMLADARQVFKAIDADENSIGTT